MLAVVVLAVLVVLGPHGHAAPGAADDPFESFPDLVPLPMPWSPPSTSSWRLTGGMVEPTGLLAIGTMPWRHACARRRQNWERLALHTTGVHRTIATRSRKIGRAKETSYWRNMSRTLATVLQNGWPILSVVGWAGDWSSYSTLTYDLKTSSANSPGTLKEVIIKGKNGKELSCDQAPPTTNWATYTVALNPSTFGFSRGEYDGVMANVQELWIRREFATGGDNAGLDNVKLTGATPPIPEFSSIILVALGFSAVAGLILIYRRGDGKAVV